jgi:glycosyltransferase involved in cell wall biosynthesis
MTRYSPSSPPSSSSPDPPTKEDRKKVLLISLEFVQPLFSGNGILTQSIVRGFLDMEYDVTVLCARPSDCSDEVTIEIESKDGSSSNQTSTPERMDAYSNLTVLIVDVPCTTWKKLDRNSCYQHLANGAMDQMSKLEERNKQQGKHHTTYDYAYAIDWSAIPTIDILKKNGIISSSTIFIFLVFRVFSSSRELCSSNDDYLFYVTRELDAIQKADITFVLSHVDKMTLVRIQKDRLGDENQVKELHIHVPPLRNDFYHQCQQLIHNPLSIPATIEPQHKHAYKYQRKYIMCNVRLSPEKNAFLFAKIMKSLSEQQTLQSLNLVPIMIGSVCDDAYAKEVYDTLPSETVIVNKFLSSTELISILNQTVLMIHPPLYDAYGMTIAEAAAAGVPSLIHHENIGASSLFRVEEGEILHGDMNCSQKLSNCVKGHLESLEKLAKVSEKAKTRALSWSVKEYAKGLELTLNKHLDV